MCHYRKCKIFSFLFSACFLGQNISTVTITGALDLLPFDIILGFFSTAGINSISIIKNTPQPGTFWCFKASDPSKQQLNKLRYLCQLIGHTRGLPSKALTAIQ